MPVSTEGGECEFVMDCFNLCKDKFDDLTSVV